MFPPPRVYFKKLSYSCDALKYWTDNQAACHNACLRAGKSTQAWIQNRNRQILANNFTAFIRVTVQEPVGWPEAWCLKSLAHPRGQPSASSNPRQTCIWPWRPPPRRIERRAHCPDSAHTTKFSRKNCGLSNKKCDFIAAIKVTLKAQSSQGYNILHRCCFLRGG